MTTNDPQIAPEVSSPTQDTTQSQHVGEKTTHPERPERRDSRFGHVVETIRHSFSIERKGSHHEAHLAKVREQDKYDRARAAEEMMWESVQAKESTSPAVEARRKSWGWPGLGTTDDASEEPTKEEHASKASGKAAALDPRAQAAAFEAIDNAAESENYGWPGLGSLPGKAK